MDECPMTMKDKVAIALQYEPAAIILYNQEAKGDYLGRSLQSEMFFTNKLVGLIGYDDGAEIVRLVQEQEQVDARLGLKEEVLLNPHAGQVTPFSSWGQTADLRIKPEITALGGHIYSTAEEDDYQTMSGMSMAAPHVAGAMALISI